MTHSQRRLFYVFALAVALLMGLPSVFTAQAADNPDVTVAGWLDYSGDCGWTPTNQSGPGGSIDSGLHVQAAVSLTPTVDDAGATDLYGVVLRDGDGNVIAATIGWMTFGSTSQVVNFQINRCSPGCTDLETQAPVSRPWTFTVYDTGATPAGGYNPLQFVLGGQQLSPTFTFDPSVINEACAALPLFSPDPLNIGIGDTVVAIFPATDDDGDPALHVYAIDDEGNGSLALIITQGDLQPYANHPPDTNTELKSTDDSKITLYVLSTGEYQLNIGPDIAGNVQVIIFDGIPVTHVYGYGFNVYDILNDSG